MGYATNLSKSPLKEEVSEGGGLEEILRHTW